MAEIVKEGAYVNMWRLKGEWEGVKGEVGGGEMEDYDEDDDEEEEFEEVGE